MAALTPDVGAHGQAVAVSGSGFFSSDGLIQAHFGRYLAPITCPSQSTCIASVPADVPSGPTTFTVTTPSGTSSPVPFTVL